MARNKYNYPEIHQSKFICLKCMQENKIVTGLQRPRQRKKFHIKNIYCLNCKKITKNIEIRFCDSFSEIEEKAANIRSRYYH
jgi:hypothetical protein